MQQLCEAGEEEFLEIMALVGMASKPLHVRRLQKALQEWVSNPREFLTSLVSSHNTCVGTNGVGNSAVLMTNGVLNSDSDNCLVTNGVENSKLGLNDRQSYSSAASQRVSTPVVSDGMQKPLYNACVPNINCSNSVNTPASSYPVNFNSVKPSNFNSCSHANLCTLSGHGNTREIFASVREHSITTKDAKDVHEPSSTTNDNNNVHTSHITEPERFDKIQFVETSGDVNDDGDVEIVDVCKMQSPQDVRFASVTSVKSILLDRSSTVNLVKSISNDPFTDKDKSYSVNQNKIKLTDCALGLDLSVAPNIAFSRSSSPIEVGDPSQTGSSVNCCNRDRSQSPSFFKEAQYNLRRKRGRSAVSGPVPKLQKIVGEFSQSRNVMNQNVLQDSIDGFSRTNMSSSTNKPQLTFSERCSQSLYKPQNNASVRASPIMLEQPRQTLFPDTRFGFGVKRISDEVALSSASPVSSLMQPNDSQPSVSDTSVPLTSSPLGFPHQMISRLPSKATNTHLNQAFYGPDQMYKIWGDFLNQMSAKNLNVDNKHLTHQQQQLFLTGGFPAAEMLSSLIHNNELSPVNGNSLNNINQ